MMPLETEADHADIYRLFHNEYENHFGPTLDSSGNRFSEISASYLEKNLKNNYFALVGAGFCTLIPSIKKAKFHGQSGGFGIGLNHQGLEKVKELYQDWKIEA